MCSSIALTHHGQIHFIYTKVACRVADAVKREAIEYTRRCIYEMSTHRKTFIFELLSIYFISYANAALNS